MDTPENNLEDLERFPATCPTCGTSFLAAILRSPFEPSRIIYRARYCEPCATAQRAEAARQESEAAAAERNRAKTDRWNALCPSEFRTLEEGGRTDVARLLREFPAVQTVIDHDFTTGEGLIVKGRTGSGKSRAAWRLLRRAFDRGKTLVALTSGEFDREARDAGGNFTLTAWVDRLAKADILFVDDLGKAPWTPATVGIWFDVLDGRYRDGRPIVVTTNLDGAALVTQLRIGPDLGEPMLRRMRETCRQVTVKKNCDSACT